MLKTKMTELLGIEHPILQGAMAWISESTLVSAVSNGGGAGVLGTGGREPEWIKAEIRRIKERTDKPFGVNVPLEKKYGERQPSVEAVLEEGAPFVTMGAGDPRPFIPRFHEAGIKVICIAPNLRLAKRVEDAGADLIVLEGMESGGRIGNLTTMALMSNILPEISTPAAAAGGIADGRGLAAALSMGADGVQMGSRFLLAEECRVHPDYPAAVLSATDTDTVATGWSRGLGMRGLKSPWAEKYLEMETSGVPLEQLNQFASGCSRRVAEQGLGPDGMNGIVQCGESVVPLKKRQPAAEIIREVVREAEEILKNLARFSAG